MMKAACALLLLGCAQAEEGPADYWAQKRTHMQSGNVIQRPPAHANDFREKVSATSAADYWAQKKAGKTGATSASDYWAQKKANLAHGPAAQNLKKSTDEFE